MFNPTMLGEGERHQRPDVARQYAVPASTVEEFHQEEEQWWFAILGKAGMACGPEKGYLEDIKRYLGKVNK